MLDGASLPAKQVTQAARRARKAEALAQVCQRCSLADHTRRQSWSVALQAHAELEVGNAAAAAALMTKSVDITAAMAHTLVIELRRRVSCRLLLLHGPPAARPFAAQ